MLKCKPLFLERLQIKRSLYEQIKTGFDREDITLSKNTILLPKDIENQHAQRICNKVFNSSDAQLKISGVPHEAYAVCVDYKGKFVCLVCKELNDQELYLHQCNWGFWKNT